MLSTLPYLPGLEKGGRSSGFVVVQQLLFAFFRAR